MPIQYFLNVSGTGGSSTQPGFENWIRIDGFTFGGETVGSRLATRPVFDDMTLDFADDTALTAFLSATTSGKALPSLQILGVDVASAKPVPVYEFKLGDVLVGDITDTNAVGFEAKITPTVFGIETTVLSTKGVPTPYADFAFDRETGKATDFALVPTPGTPNTQPPVPDGRAQYFLALDGIAGNATTPGFEGWFNVDTLTFGTNNATSLLTNGRVTGDPVNLGMDLTILLPQITEYLATGKVIDGAEIKAIATDKTGGTSTIFELSLDTVFAKEYAFDGTQPDSLTLDWMRMSLETGDAGGTESDVIAGFDKAKGVPVQTDVFDVTGQGTLRGNIPPDLDYYLWIDGRMGDSTTEATKGWFKLDDVGFSAESGASLGGAGGGASRAQFGDLRLDIHQNTGLSQFLGDLATGKTVSSASIVGLGTGDFASADFVQIDLGNTTVAALRDFGSGGYQVDLDYQEIKWTTKASVDGKLADIDQFSWDIASNAPADNVSSNFGTVAAGIAPSPGDTLTYYMRIDALDGDSQVNGLKGLIAVSDIDFSGVGDLRSKLDFGVTMESATAIPSLMSAVSNGTSFNTVELFGISQGVQTLRYKFENVFVSSYSTGSSTEMKFDAGAIGVQTSGLDAKGRAVETGDFAWDRVAGQAVPFASLPDARGGDTNGASPADTYYMLIDGIGGSALDEDHQKWIHVESFVHGASSTGGGDAGKVSFDTLVVSFQRDDGLTDLMRAAAKGEVLNGIVLDGIVTTSQGGLRSEQYKFDGVRVSDINILGTGGYTAEFVATEVGSRFETYDTSGKFVGATDFAFDLAKNLESDFATLAKGLAASGVSQAIRSDASTGYIKFDGIDGEVTAPGYENWISFNDLDFDLSSAVQIGSPPGATRPAFSSLAIDIEQMSFDAVGLNALGTGQIFDTAELHILTPGSDGKSSVVLDIDLTDVQVSRFKIGGIDGESRLSLDFGTIGLTSTGQDVKTGKYEQVGSFGWDVAANVEIGTAPPPAMYDDNPAKNLVMENVAIGTLVGVTAEGGPGAAYTLTDDVGGRFAINASTGVITTAGPSTANGWAARHRSRFRRNTATGSQPAAVSQLPSGTPTNLTSARRKTPTGRRISFWKTAPKARSSGWTSGRRIATPRKTMSAIPLSLTRNCSSLTRNSSRLIRRRCLPSTPRQALSPSTARLISNNWAKWCLSQSLPNPATGLTRLARSTCSSATRTASRSAAMAATTG